VGNQRRGKDPNNLTHQCDAGKKKNKKVSEREKTAPRSACKHEKTQKKKKKKDGKRKKNRRKKKKHAGRRRNSRNLTF